MKRKEYRVFLFSTIIASVIGLNTNWAASVNQNNEPKYLETVNFACKSIDKKIVAQEKLLAAAIKKLKEDTNTAQFFLLIKATALELQKDEVYKKRSTIKECLELLATITNYNNHLIQPNLLHQIDNFNKQPNLSCYETLASFLRRQRIHLLEMKDEYIVIQTFYRQIKNIEKDLYAQLFTVENNLFCLPCIIELQSAHATYLASPVIQDFKKTCKALWKLYLEKESKILKHRDYLDFLYEQKKTNNAQEPLMNACVENLERISALEKQLYTLPLDTQSLLNIFVDEKIKFF